MDEVTKTYLPAMLVFYDKWEDPVLFVNNFNGENIFAIELTGHVPDDYLLRLFNYQYIKQDSKSNRIIHLMPSHSSKWGKYVRNLQNLDELLNHYSNGNVVEF